VPLINARRLILVVLLSTIAGCTYVNKPLNRADRPLESRVSNHTRASTQADVPSILSTRAVSVQPRNRSATSADDRNGDGYFVGLALSGGGSRSAVFSAACMFQLERLGLLDKVDYISSVSGGSLTAAYYCLHGEEWNPGNVQHRLTHSFASDVILQIILPWNYLALALTDWDRSDIIADSFKNHLFSRNGRALTFADLRTDRPRLLINATDLQSGRPFVFCNETFDQLNSDLSKYPVAYAVAASAAVPVVMHHVTLRDFSTTFKAYRHLIDGGVTDNLGITTLVETYTSQMRSAAGNSRALPYPNGAILFVLDARTRFDANLSAKGDIGLFESLAAGAGLTSTALLNRVSSATLSEIIVKYSPGDVTAATLRAQMKQLEETGYLALHDRDGRPVRVIHLALSDLNTLSKLPFASFSEKVNNIATYFNIDPTEAYHLTVAAELLVQERFEDKLQAIAEELKHASSTSALAP
jgi:predicted acylesterase/phospholipase RssA